jgi:hypothetical protein
MITLTEIQFYKMQAGFLIKHEILKYRFVLQKDKSPFNFKSLGYVGVAIWNKLFFSEI